MKILFALLLVIALAGCSVLNREKYDRTPAGWHVHWLDQGTLTTGLHSKAQLYELFDASMDRALLECATKVNLPTGYVINTIRDRDALYELHDNFYFAVAPGSADAPTAVYASGITYNRYLTGVAFYNKAGPATNAPTDVIPWTIKASTSFPGQVYWGVETDGEQYPALSYELHWQFTSIP